jgi:DNA-directed RNA polymerase specialized sigma24 family protein
VVSTVCPCRRLAPTAKRGSVDDSEREAAFRDFVLSVEPRLRRALTATYGHERGTEATCEALAYAWERSDSVGGLDSPVAYLHRVGQSRTRPRRSRPLFAAPPVDDLAIEPHLSPAVASLSSRQRTAVLLVVGEQWTCGEVGALLGLSTSTVQRHVERGLAKLRRAIRGGDRSGPRRGPRDPAEPAS